MYWLMKKAAVQLAQKAVKADMTDVFTQINASDIVTILKGLL